MADEFTFNSAGQVHELELALKRAGGYNSALIKRMCEGDRLVRIREYLLNLAEIKTVEHLINCDADPFVPSGWSVREHQKGGSFKWNPTEVQLYLYESQRKGGVINGNELRKKLADKPVLNANVLDYLLAHPHFIPEEWKGKAVFFWGTIHRDARGNLCVRYLYWDDGGWDWAYNWLGYDWDVNHPAALRAS